MMTQLRLEGSRVQRLKRSVWGRDPQSVRERGERGRGRVVGPWVQHTLPTRRRSWTRPRSPHVFSKSQETFGRSHHGISWELRPSGEGVEVPVDWLLSRLDHRVPGTDLSWEVTLEG